MFITLLKSGNKCNFRGNDNDQVSINNDSLRLINYHS